MPISGSSTASTSTARPPAPPRPCPPSAPPPPRPPGPWVGGDGGESRGTASVHYRDRRWELQSTYVRIGERFNDEMGFVPRTGVWKFDSTYGARFRPARL